MDFQQNWFFSIFLSNYSYYEKIDLNPNGGGMIVPQFFRLATFRKSRKISLVFHREFGFFLECVSTINPPPTQAPYKSPTIRVWIQKTLKGYFGQKWWSLVRILPAKSKSEKLSSLLESWLWLTIIRHLHS